MQYRWEQQVDDLLKGVVQSENFARYTNHTEYIWLDKRQLNMHVSTTMLNHGGCSVVALVWYSAKQQRLWNSNKYTNLLFRYQ